MAEEPLHSSEFRRADRAAKLARSLKRRRTSRKRTTTRRNVPDQVDVDEDDLPAFGVGDPGDES